MAMTDQNVLSPADRARRKARRSSCAAREFIGVSDEIVAALESDDDDFFGADQESSDDELPAKRIAEGHSVSVGHETKQLSESARDKEDLQVTADVDTDSDGEITVLDAHMLIKKGCKCTKHNHLSSFTPQQVFAFQSQLQTLDPREADLYLLGLITAGIRVGDVHHHDKPKGGRERCTFQYAILGHVVCRDAFLAICMLGRTRLSRLQKEAEVFSCAPKPHGKTGSKPWNAFPPEVIETALQFIKNHAAIVGLPMPAAPRGRAKDAPTYLPASSSFKSVHGLYAEQISEGDPIMSYRSFVDLWHAKLPSVTFMTSRTDVCAACEKFRDKIRTSTTEDEKLDANQHFKDHVMHARAERAVYQESIEAACHALTDNPDDPQLTHLTFDFAENFVLPHHARQPGPVYFKVMYRVNDFGIMNEARNKQVHHLFHEAQTIDYDNKKNHGPNAVISMLHNYLENEPHAPILHLHCDNCCGQNKNRSVMAYFCWRVMAGLESSITVSFMVVGHTRCSVDGGFGLAKKRYRMSDCNTMEELSQVISSSSLQNDVNCASWEWHKWDDFLASKFRKIDGITKYHHFVFSIEHPGCVKMYKVSNDDNPISLQLSKTPPINLIDATVLPAILPAPGLSQARQQYLTKNVAPFCSSEKRNEFIKMYSDA